MKITIICDVLGEANNGTILAGLNLINSLKEKGHEVTVVSADKSTKGKEGYYVVRRLYLGQIVKHVMAANSVQLPKASKKILREAIKDADVVHILIPFNLSWAAVKIAKELDKPLTASFHCQAENVTSHFYSLLFSDKANNFVYKWFYDKCYSQVDMIHYPTEFIKDVFEKSVGRTDMPSVVISNGVKEDFFTETEKIEYEKFTIVCSGRYSTEKFQRDLLEAVANSKHKDDIKIILAGKGPRNRLLTKLKKKLELDCDMEFFDRKTLAKVLRGANLYVHTSIAEIEAISCMEAIVCGLVPLICNSEQSATRFFALDDRCLYEKNNVKELTEKIDYFYENPSAINELKEKYETEKNLFHDKDCMDQMEKMFLSVIENHNKAKTNET